MSSEDARLARPFVWAVLFSVAMVTLAVVNGNGLLTEPWRSIANVAALSLAVPMAVSTRRYNREGSGNSAALDAYGRRAFVSVVVYLATMWFAVWARGAVEPESPARWLVALAPALPVLAMLWAMGRYLNEETDEFLRHQMVTAALIGLAVVLVLATVWGCLETLELVPHVWTWWIVPAWAVGQTAGQAWVKARGR